MTLFSGFTPRRRSVRYFVWASWGPHGTLGESGGGLMSGHANSSMGG